MPCHQSNQGKENWKGRMEEGKREEYFLILYYVSDPVITIFM